MMKRFWFAVLLVAALCGTASAQSWTYRLRLASPYDSCRYIWWHGFDSVATFKTTLSDSLAWTLSATGMDTTINWVDCKIYWQRHAGEQDSAQSVREFRSNWWSAVGDSFWYQIRYWWADPPDSALRRIWIDGVLSHTDTLRGPLYHDIDSIAITDTTMVYLSYIEFWDSGSTTTGFTEVVPTMSPYTTETYIVDTVLDTLWWPDEVGPSDSDLCTVFCVYYRNHSPVRGAWLIVSNPNTGYDSTNGVILGPSLERDETSSLGIASVSALRSHMYADSLTSLYDVRLLYGGRIVKSWSRLYIPDQDTLRLEVRQ